MTLHRRSGAAPLYRPRTFDHGRAQSADARNRPAPRLAADAAKATDAGATERRCRRVYRYRRGLITERHAGSDARRVGADNRASRDRRGRSHASRDAVDAIQAW